MLTGEEGREPAIITVGRERGMNVLRELHETLITRKEVQESVKETKIGKASGLDMHAAEWLKSGEAMVTDGLVIFEYTSLVSSIQ